MPQRLKDEARRRILEAAAKSFAAVPFDETRLGDIAARAGLSASNIYKYYASKEELFSAVVTPALAGQLLRLLRARLREFNTLTDWAMADANRSSNARALLHFWLEHPHVTCILLRGAVGTRYQGLRDQIIQDMVRRALRHQAPRQSQSSADLKFVLERLFAWTLDMIADVLQRHSSAADIARIIELFWTYQLAGLQALLNDARGGLDSNEPTPEPLHGG